METKGEAFVAVQVAGRGTPYTPEAQPFPNLVEVLSAWLERTSPPVRLTRRTLLEIFKQASPPIQAAAIQNSNEERPLSVGSKTMEVGCANFGKIEKELKWGKIIKRESIFSLSSP